MDAAAAREVGLLPERRLREGIVHTPPELARFAARAAHELARSQLGLGAGLADSQLALIDPACGPGAFLAAALAVAGSEHSSPGAVCAIDRDEAALKVARAAVGAELDRNVWQCRFEARDTLLQVRPEELAQLAPVLCVLGNPPWVGSAQSRPAAWLDALLEDFRLEPDGTRLAERKVGVLADAYVRFVRWAAEVARAAEHGAVIALVTNGSYLDGPVHRGMRAALRRFFDRLYVLDLGGNAMLARARERDDNVFGVRPAVAVLVGVRGPDCDEAALAPVRYLRLCGSRRDKLDRLAELRIGDEDFELLEVDAAYQRFVPTVSSAAEYASWPSLAEAMPFHREGVQTNRDAVVVDADRTRLLTRLRAFAAGEASLELAVADKALAHYDPERARAAVRKALAADPEGKRGIAVRELAYRAFDRRWFAPVAPLCHRPRPELLAAMDCSAFALVTVRKDRGGLPWTHFSAARAAIDNCLLSTRSSCRARAFPTHDSQGRENLSPEVAAAFGERVGRGIRSPEFAHYALAVLASPAYRARHDRALRVDYPRIPWPKDAAHFDALCAVGQKIEVLSCESAATAGERQRLTQQLEALIATLAW
jgi:predicted RNA methylase